MERICIDTLHSLFYGYPSMRVPPESRMVVKRFPSQHPLPLPVGEVAAQRGRRGQITATSIGKCWHLRRQMTSRGRKALSVTCGDSSPKGRAKASYIGTRNGAYLYRYAPFTVLRLPLNARAARKSDGRKTVSVRHPCLSCGRGGQRSEDGEGQITATSILAPSQADDVALQSPAVTALPPRVYWHKKWSVSVSIRSIRQRYPSMRVPPESRMVVKRFPGPLPLPVREGR